jgi:hypothetical protein
MASKSTIAAALQSRRPEILHKWQEQVEQDSASAKGRISVADLKTQAANFLDLLVQLAQTRKSGRCWFARLATAAHVFRRTVSSARARRIFFG